MENQHGKKLMHEIENNSETIYRCERIFAMIDKLHAQLLELSSEVYLLRIQHNTPK